MRLPSLLRGWTRARRTSVKPFEAPKDVEEDLRPESAPCAANGGLDESGAAETAVRPTTTPEESRPLCGAGRPAAAATEEAADAPAPAPTPPARPRARSVRFAEVPEDCFAVAPEESQESPCPSPPVPQPAAGASADNQGDLAPTRQLSWSVEVPLSVVLANVEASFGETVALSLKSSKWDKRVQAMKAIGGVLKGLELGSATRPSAMRGLRLRDLRTCWIAACQVLHHCLRDKVIPVRLAAHELFREVFGNRAGDATLQEDVQPVARELLEMLVERLGDSNLRIHESARACFASCAARPELLGMRSTLALLRDYLREVRSRERAKAHFGVLDTLHFLLQQPACADPSGGAAGEAQRWAAEDVLPFVRDGLDDALGPRVRGIAVHVAVAVRVACGRGVEAALLEGQRPAVRTLLSAQLAMVDEEDDLDGPEGMNEDGADDFTPPADFSGLVILGTSLKAGEASAPLPGPGCVPGCVDTCESDVDDEDLLMDGILEETGHAFASSVQAMPVASSRALGPAASAAGGELDEELLEFVCSSEARAGAAPGQRRPPFAPGAAVEVC